MPVLDSDAVIAVHYDDKRLELRATFRPRARTYVYRDVPREVYDALLAADSQGAFFNAHIRDAYAFREVRR